MNCEHYMDTCARMRRKWDEPTIKFFWREPHHLGAQQVSPFFDSARDAGQWRLEHPPLSDHGPYLEKRVNGQKVDLAPVDVADCFTVFAPAEAAA